VEVRRPQDREPGKGLTPPASADRIDNPVTGELIVFLRRAADTNGELLEFESFWTRPGERAREHVHPGMEERFEVLEGVARFRIDGVERTVGPGEVVTVAPGTPHIGWNPGTDAVHLRIEFRPALRWEEVVERLFRLAQEGRTDRRGTPDATTLRQLLREYSRELAPAPTASGAAGYS
jgi:mannose-6-phosphate isomerase-like protein (cupin superfamily)